MRFERGITLHTHLGMDGSWRIAPRAAWLRRCREAPVGRPRCRPLPPWRSVRDAPVVELLDDVALRRHPRLVALGPDLCLPNPILDEIGRRLSTLVDPTTEIGVALLDQRVASGIGNVYRSEVLWACRTDSVRAGRRRGHRQPPGALRDRGRAAPAEPRRRAATDGPRGSRRLRAHTPTLPPVRDADRLPATRRARPDDLVVPRLPGRRRMSAPGRALGARGCTLGDRLPPHRGHRGRSGRIRGRRQRDRCRPGRGRHARGRVPAGVRRRRRPVRPGGASRARRR